MSYPPMPAPMSAPVPRRRRGLFWSAVAAALVLLIGGTALAVIGYQKTSGPDGAVRGYFAALARSDAPAALAFGVVPDGPRNLLTSTVLERQQTLAPLQGVAVRSVTQRGDTARVDVGYQLAFPGRVQQISDTVSVRRINGDWKLAQAAIATQLQVLQAGQRASILGTAIPEGTTLLFPGAVPITFDSPYLQIKASEGVVTFGAAVTTQVFTEVSAAGRKAALDAFDVAIRKCIAAAAEPGCPLPGIHAVPGTLRASVSGRAAERVTVDVGDSAVGTIVFTGSVTVTGTYRFLDFDNQGSTKSGPVDLPVHASAYAVKPIQLTWTTG